MIHDLELAEENETVDLLNIPRHLEGLEFIRPITSYRKKTPTVPFCLAPLEGDHLAVCFSGPTLPRGVISNWMSLLITLSDFLLSFLLQSAHVWLWLLLLSYMDLCWQSNVSAFSYAVQVCHSLPSKEQEICFVRTTNLGGASGGSC